GFGGFSDLAKVPARLFSRLSEPYRWLGDTRTAMLSCVIPMVWAGMGPGCLIYLAALKGIPDEYYEAADVDGATFIDKIMFVIFPNLKMLIIINFVGVFITSWYGATGTILAMTGGGANTEVAGLHIWYEAFTYLRFGPATAMAWMLGFMMIGFTVNQLRMLSKVEFRAAGVKT
ncbi:MAG: sugar ABC transporter permease, partial [Victivallales bacterium]|nr:sugar ABC transporter permease [Victivallales bacterium]